MTSDEMITYQEKIIEQLHQQLVAMTSERDVLLIAHKAHETSNLLMLAKLKQQAFELEALKREVV